jgi:hypothetical protein
MGGLPVRLAEHEAEIMPLGTLPTRALGPLLSQAVPAEVPGPLRRLAITEDAQRAQHLRTDVDRTPGEHYVRL